MLGKPQVVRGMYRMGGMMAKRSAFLDIIKDKGGPRLRWGFRDRIRALWL